MADHVVVMRAGCIEQQGPPLDLYDRPANRFVASFIGSPAINVLPAVVDEDGTMARIDGAGAHDVVLPFRLAAGRQVLVGLRPEHIALDDPRERDAALAATVEHCESTGSMSFLRLRVGAHALVVATSTRTRFVAGQPLRAIYRPERLHVFDAGTGQTLTSKAPPAARDHR